MRERKRGTLRSGRSGKKVTSRKQAIAIGLSQARRAGAKVPRKKNRSGGKKKLASKKLLTRAFRRLIVNLMVNYSGSLDSTFAALADPTRRAILARLALSHSSVTDLASPFEMSLPAISKHLRVLESAGLLVRRKEGRVHWCSLQPGPMKRAAGWIAHYQQFWEERLDALEKYLNEQEKEEKRWPTQKRYPQLRRASGSSGRSRPPGRRSSVPGRTRKPS